MTWKSGISGILMGSRQATYSLSERLHRLSFQLADAIARPLEARLHRRLHHLKEEEAHRIGLLPAQEMPYPPESVVPIALSGDYGAWASTSVDSINESYSQQSLSSYFSHPSSSSLTDYQSWSDLQGLYTVPMSDPNAQEAIASTPPSPGLEMCVVNRGSCIADSHVQCNNTIGIAPVHAFSLDQPDIYQDTGHPSAWSTTAHADHRHETLTSHDGRQDQNSQDVHEHWVNWTWSKGDRDVLEDCPGGN